MAQAAAAAAGVKAAERVARGAVATGTRAVDAVMADEARVACLSAIPEYASTVVLSMVSFSAVALPERSCVSLRSRGVQAVARLRSSGRAQSSFFMNVL